MPELKRTTVYGKDEHFHVIYFSERNSKPYGISSISGDTPHFHEVVYKEAVPAIIDETGKQIVPAIPAKFELAEENKHTHDIVPFENSSNEENTPEDEALEDVYDCWKVACEEEEDFEREAKEDEEFVMQKQWTDKVRTKLAEQERSILTIDHITPKLDVLSGIQRQNRYDIKYYPRKGGSVLAADMFTQATKIYWDWNNADYEETDVFDDQITVGRGLWNCYLSYDNSLDGDIIIEKFDWDGVKFGPHSSKYLKDCQFLVKYEWTNKAKLKNEYPDLADKISQDNKLLFTKSASVVVTAPGTAYQDKDNYSEVASFDYNSIKKDKTLVDLLEKKYVKIELHKRVYRRISIAVMGTDIDPEDNRPPMFNLDGYDAEEIAQIKSLEGMKIVKQPINYIKIITVAGGVKLDERRSDFNIFDIVPAYGKKRKGFICGKVRNLKDPQRELNKRHSQAMDIINNSANYTEFYDNQTMNAKQIKEYKENANNPRHFQEVLDVNRLPKTKEGVKVPNEILTMEELSKNQIEYISNIPNEMQGLTSAQQSGLSQMEAKRAGLQGNEFLFDNLGLARRQIGRWLLQAIPKIHTAESFVNMLYDSASQGEMIKVGGLPIDAKDKDGNPIYDKEYLTSIMEDAFSGKMDKYDVKVGESAASPTKRYENYIKTVTASQMGIQMPPELVLEYMDVSPDIKEKVLESMAQQQQASQQMEMMKYQAEYRKSVDPAIIAAQGKSKAEAIDQGGQMMNNAVQQQQQI